VNVSKLASYIAQHANDQVQFLVISLKSLFYEKADALVGIYRDQETNASQVLTLKLQGLAD
jgi:structural maintenance of chromosome 1